MFYWLQFDRTKTMLSLNMMSVEVQCARLCVPSKEISF